MSGVPPGARGASAVAGPKQAMNFLQPTGSVLLNFFATVGRLATLAADDNLPPSEKVYTPWADTIVPLTESALLKEESS